METLAQDPKSTTAARAIREGKTVVVDPTTAFFFHNLADGSSSTDRTQERVPCASHT